MRWVFEGLLMRDTRPHDLHCDCLVSYVRTFVRLHARTYTLLSCKGAALVDAVKEKFPGASVTRCERGKVDVDLVLGVDSFSLDKALEARKSALFRRHMHACSAERWSACSLSLPHFVL